MRDHCAILATCHGPATKEDSRESIERDEQKSLQDKLHDSLRGVLHWAMCEKLLQRCCSRCEKNNQVLLFAMVATMKKWRDTSVSGYVPLGNFSCYLCRNKIVRQVALNVA